MVPLEAANRVGASLALALLVTAPALASGLWQGEEGQPGSLAEVLERPSLEAGAAHDGLAARLAARPGAAASVLSALATGSVTLPSGVTRELGRSGLQLCEAMLPHLPAPAVRAAAASVLEGGADERAAALELLAAVAGPEDASLALALAAEGSARAGDSGRVVGAFQAVALRLLTREPATFAELEAWALGSPALVEPLLEVVGRTQDPRGLVFVLRNLDQRVAAMRTLFRLAPHVSSEEARVAARELRSLLSSAEPELRRLVFRSLGALGDAASASVLVEALSAPEVMDRKAAHAALRSLSGLDLPEDPIAWGRWLEQERRWVLEAAPRALADLAAGDDAAALRAVGALSTHTLLRREAATLLARAGREHASPAVRMQALRALPRIGSPLGHPALVSGLTDDVIEVRGAALAALRATTGAKHPADPALWRVELGLTAR